MISLDVVLKAMQEAVHGESKTTFSICFLTCNRDKLSGGEFIEVARAQKHGLKSQAGYKYMVGIYDHLTGRRMAVHERLIFKFNGQEVYW